MNEHVLQNLQKLGKACICYPLQITTLTNKQKSIRESETMNNQTTQ
jgi:hypothetical protein